MDCKLLEICINCKKTIDKIDEYLNYMKAHPSNTVLLSDNDERKYVKLPKEISDKLIIFLENAKKDYENDFNNFEIIKKGE